MFEAFTSDAGGAWNGTQRITSPLKLGQDSDKFNASASLEIFDTNGTLLFTGCSTAVGRCMEWVTPAENNSRTWPIRSEVLAGHGRGVAARLFPSGSEPLKLSLIHIKRLRRSELSEFVSFPNGSTEELQAVKAALSYEISQGQVEGQGNRLKMVQPHVQPTMQQGATKRNW